MTIDFAIVSTDNNPLYAGFWEITRRLWKEVIGVQPLLVEIADKDFSIQEFSTHTHITLRRVPNISTGFQAQIARLYITQYFKDHTLLTSDLDMFPLNKEYFVDQAVNCTDDTLVIYTADAYGFSNQVRYPMCYNLAKGSTYCEILNQQKDFASFVQELHSLNLGWDTDELYYGKKVCNFEATAANRVLKLWRGWREGYATGRVDRSWWNTSTQSTDILVDFHSLRPYSENKEKIESILNRI